MAVGAEADLTTTLVGPAAGRQEQQHRAGDRSSSDPMSPGALTTKPPALSLDRLPFRTGGSVALSSASRSASSDSEQSSTRTDATDDGSGADSGFARLSAASSVSSLHASDDGQSAAGLNSWLKDAVDGRSSSTSSSLAAREEATPRAERPPVLELTTTTLGTDEAVPGPSSG